MNISSEKCNVSFISKYAYFDGMCVGVDDYLTDPDGYHGHIKCLNGHRLCFVYAVTRTKHFRHINPDDCCGSPMTGWHAEWQSNFAYTEIVHNKLAGQVSRRIADAVVGDRVIEFQHSRMLPSEGHNRIKDYWLHGKEVIWVIHGYDVDVAELPLHKRCFLTFKQQWMYCAYVDSPCIWVEVDSFLYKVNPCAVRNNMIDVNTPLAKEDFIAQIKLGDPGLLLPEEVPQCVLNIMQQGAGNGKTYGLVQRATKEELSHYDIIVMVTKQHSAKHIIASEFKDQYEKGYLQHISLVPGEKPGEFVDLITDCAKKLEIRFIDETSRERSIIIGTIDSLMCTMGVATSQSVDKFQSIVESVAGGEADGKDSINYAYKTIKLNKKICLVCDEIQDLPKRYAQAIIRLMRNRYIDCVVVEDMLQSISFEDNAFAYLLNNEFPNIKKIENKKTNICRRFGDSKLVEFVNKSIKFGKFDLPQITAHEDSESADSLKVFVTEDGGNESAHSIKDVAQIMTYYRREVENGAAPNDFLIVTPIIANRPVIHSLNEEINAFWRDKYADDADDAYKVYSILHKSSVGSSIDLSESDETTRIVSIHASKGDGRPIVILVDLCERSLQVFCQNDPSGLIYESLLHVAITRMKKKLYIQLTSDVDEIAGRFAGYYDPHDRFTVLKNRINLRSLSERVSDNDSTLLRKEFNCDIDAILEKETRDHKIIDMGHHLIRFAAMKAATWIRIVNLGERKQIRKRFSTLIDAPIIEYYDFPKYLKALEGKNNCSVCGKFHKPACKGGRYFKRMPHIPVFVSKKQVYRDLNEIIMGCMRIVQKKLQRILEGARQWKLCPYESVILHYMTDIAEKCKHSSVRYIDILHITHIYKESFDGIIGADTGHESCICGKFVKKNNIMGPDGDLELSNYIKDHYEILSTYLVNLESFIAEHPDLNYLTDKYERNGIFSYEYNLVGFNDANTYNIIMHPAINELNIVKLVNEAILSNFHLCHLKEPEESSLRRDISNQTVHAVLLSSNTRHEIAGMNKDQHSTLTIDIIKVCAKLKLFTEAKSIISFIRARPGKSASEIHTEYGKKYIELGHNVPTYVDRLFAVLDALSFDLSDEPGLLILLKKQVDKFVDDEAKLAFEK